MLFLHSHGVSTSRAVRIFQTYWEQAIEKVRGNPYMLAKDIYGIGRVRRCPPGFCFLGLDVLRHA